MATTRRRNFDPRTALQERIEKDVVSERVKHVQHEGFRPDPKKARENLSRFAQDIRGLSLSRFGHTYSRLEPGNIRIVIIQPGAGDEPLELDMVKASLADPPEDSPPINSVVLRDWTVPSGERYQTSRKQLQFLLFREVGTRILVRRNLYDALLRFRHRRNTTKLWVDAICINQKNNLEKTHQIQQMADIYNKAVNVRIWLGGASERSDIGMEFAKDLIRFEDLKKILPQEDALGKWIALIELMRSRWFSRRWVIQEQAVAKRSTLYCGEKAIVWDDFADAVSVFKGRLPTINANFRNQTRLQKPEALSAIEAFGAATLVRSTAELMRKDEDGTILEKYRSLEELVSTLVAFEGMDPRDTIYAVLSIARTPQLLEGPNTQASPLEPDYQKSILEVYTDFVQNCVRTSMSLDIILRHWAPVGTGLVVELARSEMRRVETVLPSWIKQLDESPFGTPSKIFRGRKNGDSLVGSRPIYNASERFNRATHAKFGKRLRPNNITETDRSKGVLFSETFDGSLEVEGIIMGDISDISARIIPGILPQEVLKMGGWRYSRQDQDHPVTNLPHRLWRTLVANRGPDGRSPEISYRRSCLHALQHEDVSGDVRIDDLIANQETSDEVRSYLNRARDVLWNRKAFIVDNNDDLFGIGPKSAEKGDLVCILYGCSVPVILRRVNEKPEVGQKLVPKSSEGSQALMNTQVRVATSDIVAYNSVATVSPAGEAPENTASEPGGNPWAEANTPSYPDIAPKEYFRVIGECYVDARMEGEAIDHKDYRDKRSLILV